MASPPHKVRWIVFLFLAGLALAIRLPRLGQRPMHTDEATNGYIVGQVMSGEPYQYDPRDRHGPALCALTLPLVWMAGARTFADLTAPMLRLMPVIVGSLTVLLFGALVEGIGWWAAALAAWFFVVGPLPVYYNRYFIHETPFVACTLGWIACGWRLMEQPTVWRGVGVGVCAGLMLACKETAVLHFAALGAAGLWWGFVRYRSSRANPAPSGSRASSWGIAGAAALFSFLFLFLTSYTWGGRHWEGPLDLVRSYTGFASRAGGQGHEKPAGYYVSLLAGGWSGGVMLALALFGAILIARDMIAAFGPTAAPDATAKAGHQALLVYAILVFAIYCGIPYKTPWLALNFWLPLALLAGYGIAFLWRRCQTGPTRAALGAGVCALTVLLAHDTWERAYVRPFDEKNPYAYAHTTDDLLLLPERLAALARSTPGHTPRIAVLAADPWPLPWYLRKFPQVGFWQPGQDPGSADFYITSTQASDQLAARLKNWRLEFFGVRPGVLILLWTPPGEGAAHD